MLFKSNYNPNYGQTRHGVQYFRPETTSQRWADQSSLTSEEMSREWSVCGTCFRICLHLFYNVSYNKQIVSPYHLRELRISIDYLLSCSVGKSVNAGRVSCGTPQVRASPYSLVLWVSHPLTTTNVPCTVFFHFLTLLL